MNTNFQISALHVDVFSTLFNLPQEELEKIGAVKMIADKNPGFPCRVSLEDAAIGDEVILLSYPHHQSNSPYQSSGPIFVRRNVETATLAINEIPLMLNHRSLSLRGYDKTGIMKEALLTEGYELRQALVNTFSNPEIDYIHIHNAKPGCYNCVAKRA